MTDRPSEARIAEEKRAIRNINYWIHASGRGGGSEPTQEWQDGYDAGYKERNEEQIRHDKRDAAAPDEDRGAEAVAWRIRSPDWAEGEWRLIVKSYTPVAHEQLVAKGWLVEPLFTHPRKSECTFAETAEEKAHTRALQQRDDREDVINELCDAVLGADRPEWSSAYGFSDAIADVEERVELMKRKPFSEVRRLVEEVAHTETHPDDSWDHTDGWCKACEAINRRLSALESNGGAK